MGGIVEANSLSGVIDIASNPPTHPQAPTKIPLLPLTLYIARVPGSRDVFLTPLKPRQKVVSAEDVQSSIYYVHVNIDIDENVPPQSSSSSTLAYGNASEDFKVQNGGIRRKPVLPRRPVTVLRPPYPMSDYYLPKLPPRPRSNNVVEPQSTHVLALQAARLAHKTNEGMVDLPVLPERPASHRSTAHQSQNGSSQYPNGNFPRHREPYNRSDLQSMEQVEPQSAITSNFESTECQTQTSLTLIRRNPSSSVQWNVASIYDPSVKEVSSATSNNTNLIRKTKGGGAPLYLDITNPSYAQFSNNETRRTSCYDTSTSSLTSGDDASPDTVFRRRLYVPGSPYGIHEYNFREQRRFGSVDSNNESSPNDYQSSFADRRSRGYTFISPWGGQCEFSASKTNQSLKCRHRLPTSVESEGADKEVSELRFNLPNPARTALNTSSEKRNSLSESNHRRIRSVDCSAADGTPITPTFTMDENGRLDLQLGRERAGGGFGGKQAKLGKLIIHPEGLKMLDLLVAANMGLWWRAYERT